MSTASLRAIDLLHQDRHWLTTDLHTIDIDNMTPGHRRAVLAWLRDHAAELHESWLTALLLEPEPENPADRVAQAAAIVDHRNTDPRVWLDDTPLVRRLATLDQRRRFLANPRRWFR